MKKGKFIIISGPSGVGKGTIFDKIVKELNGWYSISSTTREIRPGEVPGEDYYYLTKEEFEKQISEGKFLEYNLYNNNYYGTSKDTVLEKIHQGINVFLEIDVNGASNIKKMFPDALLIYIAPPSIEDLRKRLLNRATESIEKIDERIKIATEELKKTDIYDYVVINDEIERATEEVRNIILSHTN